jgi:hypothetical protein
MDCNSITHLLDQNATFLNAIGVNLPSCPQSFPGKRLNSATLNKEGAIHSPMSSYLEHGPDILAGADIR